MGAGCVVWRGSERIYATVVSAIAVGTPLRMLLPPEARYVLAECALATVVAVSVAVRPSLLVGLGRGAKKAAVGLRGMAQRPVLAMRGVRRVGARTYGGGI